MLPRKSRAGQPKMATQPRNSSSRLLLIFPSFRLVPPLLFPKLVVGASMRFYGSASGVVRPFRIQKEKPATHIGNGRLHHSLHSGQVPRYSRNFHAPIFACRYRKPACPYGCTDARIHNRRLETVYSVCGQERSIRTSVPTVGYMLIPPDVMATGLTIPPFAITRIRVGV